MKNKAQKLFRIVVSPNPDQNGSSSLSISRYVSLAFTAFTANLAKLGIAMAFQTSSNSRAKKILTARLTRGTFLIEALVGIAIIVSAVIAAFFYYGTALKVAKQSTDRVQAGIILSETAEAVRSMRDQNWTNVFSLVDGTDYHLVFSGTSWQATTTPQLVESRFTRTFTTVPVYRDANEDIVLSGGTVDPDIKEIVMNVEWNTSGELSASGRLYLANIFE